MMLKALTIAILALANSGIAAPSQLDMRSVDTALMQRGISAATCLARLCCSSIRRDVQGEQISQNTQSEAAATCLVCWELGVCQRNAPKHIQAKGTVDISSFVEADPNFKSGGFWISHGGGEYWIDKNARAWEWEGHQAQPWRDVGPGTIRQEPNGHWVYVFSG